LSIQKLLAEAGPTVVGNQLVSVEPRGPEAAANWKQLQSEENYVGYARTQNLASPGGIKTGKSHVYKVAEALRLNEWALSGDWTMGLGSIVFNQSDGSVSYRFHASDLHLVMKPTNRGKTARFRELIDENHRALIMGLIWMNREGCRHRTADVSADPSAVAHH
jgi:hypothetical protein